MVVETWWLGVLIPAAAAGLIAQRSVKKAQEQEKSFGEVFGCERVCTSKRMLKKIGASSENPSVDTCVTVCGVSELDACSDACVRTVCANQHQVPNWNDVCIKRCQSECLKLSSIPKL